MIWRSPLWMPLAWEVVAVQFGYIGLRLWERFGKTGLLMIGLLGAINIPFYEEMARRIHWWQYSGCRMISSTPWYIIVGEFGIAVVFALLARTLRRDSWRDRRYCRRRWWSIDFCLLYDGFSDYRPADEVIERCKIRIVHRIVSLLPAATEIAAALGLMDQVVGVSHDCDFPDEANHVRVLRTAPCTRPI